MVTYLSRSVAECGSVVAVWHDGVAWSSFSISNQAVFRGRHSSRTEAIGALSARCDLGETWEVLDGALLGRLVAIADSYDVPLVVRVSLPSCCVMVNGRECDPGDAVRVAACVLLASVVRGFEDEVEDVNWSETYAMRRKVADVARVGGLVV